MRKKAIPAVALLVLAILALVTLPATRDEIHWRWVSRQDEAAGYASYARSWPTGRHLAKAMSLYDERSWANALTTNTVHGFKQYARAHEHGRHIGEAKENIEALEWLEATGTQTVWGYEMYLRLHPEGRHAELAKEMIESLEWQEAEAKNSVQGYEKYLRLHPDGRHVVESMRNIEKLLWQRACIANTIMGYQQFAMKHPNGQYARDAEKRASDLRLDDAPFNAVLKAATADSLKRFTEEFPGHQRAGEIERILKDISEDRDIVDLLREEKIEIETSGSGIQSVGVRIRKLVPYPVTVRIPVGSFFVSSRQSSQNMVATSEIRITLADDKWRNVSVPAACANRPRDIPGAKDTFSVRQSPHQAELARLMPFLEKHRVDFATRQAAVWIVTDNASYSELGILVSRQGNSPYGGTRNIRHAHAARAMQICDEAGIDITVKRIWLDRLTILNELNEGGLKEWLKER